MCQDVTAVGILQVHPAGAQFELDSYSQIGLALSLTSYKILNKKYGFESSRIPMLGLEGAVSTQLGFES